MSTGDISVKFTGEVAEYLREATERAGTTVDEVIIQMIVDHRLQWNYWDTYIRNLKLVNSEE